MLCVLSPRPSAAQCRAFGGDQAAPDTVLADIPVPQRKRQAWGSHQAGRADGDGGGRLLASLARLGTDREPLVGIKAAISAPGVPDDPGPRGLIGDLAGDQQEWPPHGALSKACTANSESTHAVVRGTAMCSLLPNGWRGGPRVRLPGW